MRYEEDEVFPDDLFYSFYDYSWQAVLAYRHIGFLLKKRGNFLLNWYALP